MTGHFATGRSRTRQNAAGTFASTYPVWSRASSTGPRRTNKGSRTRSRFVSGFCSDSEIGTCPHCLCRKTGRRIPAASASVEPYAILVCHSRERGNPLPRVPRCPWFLDSCLRRNDSVCLGILPCFEGRHTPTLPVPPRPVAGYWPRPPPEEARKSAQITAQIMRSFRLIRPRNPDILRVYWLPS